ncbi:MAG: group 1 glycosyl transferase [Pelagibacterium sp. SCN 63-23]|nr:MAG: group 1 glycosyl transferase [Pelagibacterium sp. SCN 63-23]
MKILFLAAGSSIHTIRWINALAQSRLEVVLATQQEPIEPVDPGVTVHRLPFSGELGYFRNVPALRRLLAEEKPDLLNAHYASGYGTTMRLSGFAPTLLSVWGSDVYDFPRKSPLHRWWVRGNLMAADQVASTSHIMAKQTLQVAPGLGQIAITPFGVETSQFVPTDDRVKAPDAPIVIGSVKTLAPKYGIDTLINAVALLIDDLKVDRPDLASRIRLRLVGGGPQADALKALAMERGIAGVSEFRGSVAHREIPAQLQDLDIYAALSRLDSESFGVAILEAGACGLPVVVSDAGGLPEVVLNGETGIVVPRNSPAAAAEALRKLVLDRGLHQRIGIAGRNHVATRYEWNSCVGAMIALYERVISQNRA